MQIANPILKAEVKRPFTRQIGGENVEFAVGVQLDFVQRDASESGTVTYNGHNICENHSPFAKSHFYMLDDRDLELRRQQEKAASLKGKVIKPIEHDYDKKPIYLPVGTFLDVVPGPTPETFLCKYGERVICLSDSAFAKKHIAYHAVSLLYEVPEKQDVRINTLRERLTNATESDHLTVNKTELEWLLEQAEKTNAYEKTLNEIAKIDINHYNAVDASYWALVALKTDDI